jgi:hypothetical protein
MQAIGCAFFLVGELCICTQLGADARLVVAEMV